MKNKRFKFGKNWQRFLRVLNDDRIREAERSLTDMLGLDRLDGKLFLDIGSGSGLFSLAARRLGATVHSFDYDEQSVACTEELKRRYHPDDPNWTIERGDILDETYVAHSPKADIAYSWGVLHHTGNMWKALENTRGLVKEGGMLYIAIYNDQGWKSSVWRALKRVYVSSWLGRITVTAAGSIYFVLICLKEDLAQRRNPLSRYRDYRKNRGMSIRHDWIDWFGGYPFECASRESVEQFYAERGFSLKRMKSAGRSLGCNEWVFEKNHDE